MGTGQALGGLWDFEHLGMNLIVPDLSVGPKPGPSHVLAAAHTMLPLKVKWL